MGEKAWAVLVPVEAIRVVCEDCGRARRYTEGRIRSMAIPSGEPLDRLGSRFVCTDCRGDGGLGQNVRVEPFFVGARWKDVA